MSQSTDRFERRFRRGNYATLFVFSLPAIIGFGALAVDISYQRMAQAQAQDVADAASQAAVITLRRTSDVAQARRAAELAVELNPIADGTGTLTELTFGVWSQREGEEGTFLTGAPAPNAVRVRVERPAGYLLAPIIGFDGFTASGESTSASRNLHVVLSVDITNSWSPSNFRYAREASELFLSMVRGSAGPYDKIGMNVFTGGYAWEFTPLSTVRDTAVMDGIAAEWSILRTASKPGTPTSPSDAPGCSLPWEHPSVNERFESPPPGALYGGCYPNMPREYMGTDGANCTYGSECGTDHTVGMEMARRMFLSEPDDTAFRAHLLLTDGEPNGVQSHHGIARENLGFVETRWPEYKGPVPHGTAEIRQESIDLSEEMWELQRVHTWVVSFVKHDWFMPEMVQGQGYYKNTNSAEALAEIFRDIASSLPIAVVQ